MNDPGIFIVRAAEEGIQTVGELDALTFKPKAPQNGVSLLFALNSKAVAHCENMASANCLALGQLPPGGEGISIPFQAFAKEQFGSPLLTRPQ